MALLGTVYKILNRLSPDFLHIFRLPSDYEVLYLNLQEAVVYSLTAI